jgi:hypothetical protein
MNRALPPRDRGNRVADSFRPSRSPRVVPCVIRLVGGVARPRRGEIVAVWRIEGVQLIARDRR